MTVALGSVVAMATLVSRLSLLLPEGALHVPSHDPLAEAMATELEGFEIGRTEAADLTFDAFSTGKHDDLVIACALACWQRMDRRQYATVELLAEHLGCG